jgi:hypothetical protein
MYPDVPGVVTVDCNAGLREQFCNNGPSAVLCHFGFPPEMFFYVVI